MMLTQYITYVCAKVV